jgi:deoxycytidine triphosphate deaminase
MAAMSVLSDGTIRRFVDEGRIHIEPWDPVMLQPASVDLRLGNSFRVFHNHRIGAIDLADPPRALTEHVEVGDAESFVIHPGEFVLGRTEEYVELPDDLVARIEGKALALDTEVPTPFGWRTMGDLAPGDVVFNQDGEPTLVVAATEPMARRPCAEVVFSDGTAVIADLQHQWVTESSHDRRLGRGPQVRTTADIERTLAYGNHFSHVVGGIPPVEYARKELPTDPYALGIGIGDGAGSGARVTAGGRVLAGAVAAGASRHEGGSGRFAREPSATRIPEDYLQAGVEQREALLAGLMQSEACADKAGRCTLTTADRALAEQCRELAASLGLDPVISTKTSELHGKVCGLRHQVSFARSGTIGTRGRTIVGVWRIPSVPVRCIEVADPRGVFLVTRSFIPTHNSSLGRLGLIVHATAGFVDPGFRGTLTLEITNLTRVPIVLWPGKPIAQLSFMTLDRPAERPYGHPELGSHYHGQVDATESRYEGGPGAGRREAG